MRRGDFEAAWRQTDRIETNRRALEASGRFTREPHYLSWNGAAFDARRVLVRCAHGLGDTLQFVRYVPLLRERARTVDLLVQPELLPVFEGETAFGTVSSGWTEGTPPHEVEIEIMELPYAFRSTVDTVPNEVPYLPSAALDRAARTLPVLDAGATLNVGLLWSASDWDTSRSVPLELFAPLGRVEGVRYYSLQQGVQRERWRTAPFHIEPLHEHTSDIAAAGAAMRRLDLIITVDGMGAHLAGALGRPVWVLLKQDADWRWMEHRADSPWYPTMRLFRQHERGYWPRVVDDVVGELSRACAARAFRTAAASP
jgi:hypothetical protein